MSIIKKLLFVAAMSLGIAALAAGQELPQLPNDPAVRTGKLDNGLTYYIRHNATCASTGPRTFPARAYSTGSRA